MKRILDEAAVPPDQYIIDPELKRKIENIANNIEEYLENEDK
jgi:hypothetical protein